MKTMEEKTVSKKTIRNRTLVSFFFLFLFFGACYWSWTWLHKQPLDGTFGAGIRQPLRDVLNTNEKIFSEITFSKNHLSKTYPSSAATKNVRFNGDLGLDLKNKFDTAAWRLNVVKANGDTLQLTLDDIKKLPRT